MGKDMSFEITLNFDQILELVKQLPDEEQVQLLSEIKDLLENKGLVKWNEEEDGKRAYLLARSMTNKTDKKLLADKETRKKWREELPDEDEIEMTDEEFIKAVKEMS